MLLISVHMFWFGVAHTTDGRGSKGLLCDAACLSHAQTSFKKVHPGSHHSIIILIY